ncbi:DUF2306 domain-containing protein [Herbidospora galbida]|uniref:DUF2306 domain-containing protein n=1 Tax=Herbidospora galbida TaxID=2575442 RepID=A0A4V5V0Z9_9ACTN|nr:DUF2306 domain-containing protein [Herbidospora galbida]TKK87123.1 DUF2306 domain-containing protein [Herbidospora galbida]
MTLVASRRRPWLLPAGLVLLGLIPTLGGGVRLGELSSGGPVTPDNLRFFDMPLPVVAHIVGAVVYALVGAFQFVPALRRGSWHRRAGRVLAVAGLTVALSGIWMALWYDMPESDDGLPMTIMRVGVGGVMAFAVVYAVLAVRRRDFTTHRAWMIRAYALAMGAGTQAFTHVPFAVAGVTPDDAGRFAAMAAGWAINAAVAEWAIRRS